MTMGGLDNAGSFGGAIGNLIQVNGNATNSGQIDMGGYNTLNISGNLTNSGTINIASLSKMVVGTGNPSGPGYIQFANGTLGEIITNAGFGVINVTGPATLAGTLDIMLQSGFDPSVGTAIKFLNFTPNDLNGAFTKVENDIFNNGTEIWVLTYDNADGFVELTAEVAPNQDHWLGGTDNWSNGGKWSSGVPGAANNVTIYSGSNDLVTLDAGTTTISSLTLGGANNGTTSELTDGGVKQTLVITDALNVGQTGILSLTGGSTVSVTDPSNAGTIDLENASTLKVAGDLSNSGTLVTNMNGLGGMNTITINGTLTNDVGGQFILNGPGDMATIGRVDNSGLIHLGGTALSVTGDVNNSGTLEVFNFGGETVNITGTLTNSGTFQLVGFGETATIGSVTNSGTIDLGDGSVLSVTGDMNNSGTLECSANYCGNTWNIGGMLTNSGTFTLNAGPFDMATIGGSVNNSGTIDLEAGSVLSVTGDMNNSGTLEAGLFFGGTTIAINGLLTNTATGQINLYGDVLQALGGLSNSGTINVNNGSSIDPPFLKNLGIINIDSMSRLVVGTPTPTGGQGYIQLHNGTLTEVISSPTSYGVINVSGSALLDGALAVLLQGYSPTAGSEFKFLTFTPGELSGMFSDEPGGPWDVIYDKADGYVELKYVPEPATLLVLIPGLLGMGYGLRRKLFA